MEKINTPTNSDVELACDDNEVDERDCEELQKRKDSSSKKKILKSPKPSSNNKTFCICKRSKCLRLYCQCFKNNKFCGENCSCKDCYNIPKNKEIIELWSKDLLLKHNQAFERKIKKSGRSDLCIPKQGCNCKKTSCKKKYCECFSSGIPCTQFCKCDPCSNDRICLNKDTKVLSLEKEVHSSNKKGAIEMLLDKIERKKLPKISFKKLNLF